MSNYEELEKLAKLKEQWILSDEEFEIEKKKLLSNQEFKSKNEDKISNDNKNWLNRLWFNLIFFFIIIPLLFLNSIMPPFNNDIWAIAFLILLIVSIFRFQNLWMSWWYSLWLFIPFFNFYLLFKLIFIK